MFISNVLKSISYIRDNAYELHRRVWNDVHEDWPFYSEQDRATLKRYNAIENLIVLMTLMVPKK
jgi:hypothetical protein